MTDLELKNFINEHLYNEIKYLLCATASWEKAKNSESVMPPHYLVFTMDSAYLHARALFEFFTYKGDSKRKKLVTWKDFKLKERLHSEFYLIWEKPLHNHLMHIKNRLDSSNEIKKTHLKNMVIEFTAEITYLWNNFSNNVDKNLQETLNTVFKQSMIEAETILPRFEKLLQQKKYSEIVEI